MSANQSNPNPEEESTSDYPYYKYIKSPTQMGMNSKGKNITKNFKGLMSYVGIIMYGKSKASSTGQPLGNRVFLKAPSKCKDVSNNTIVDRYLYIDNIPNGKLQFDVDMTDSVSKDEAGNTTMEEGTTLDIGFKGLVPGILQDVTKINPITLFKELEDDTYPPCTNVTLDTMNNKNIAGAATHYVSNRDLKWVDSCFFADNYNPVTKVKCKKPHKHIPPPPVPTTTDPTQDPSTTTVDSFINHYTHSFDKFTHVYTKLDNVLIAIILIYYIFISLYVINKFIRI
jgi:hypothetical protein